MPASYTTMDWITREDMAVLIRKSPDTVRRQAKKHDLAERTDEAGRVLVSVGDFLRLGHLRPEDLAVGATPAESAEVLRARETLTALRVQVGELTGRLGHADTLVSTLTDQLAYKDRQLATQAAQLTQLTQLLGRLAAAGGAA